MSEGEESRPVEVKFVGVSKERGLGGVMYEMNTVGTATWLREKTNMSDFLKNMGSTMDYKEQMYDMVIDWTPVSFEINQPDSWRAVKKASGLKKSAIKDASWIKPTHLCVPGQKSAIVIFKLASREDANLSGSYQVTLVSPDPADLRCIGSCISLPASISVVLIPDPSDSFLASHLIIILKHLCYHP